MVCIEVYRPDELNQHKEMQIAAASRGQNKPTAGFQSYLKKKIFTSKDAHDQQENLLGKTQQT